MKKPYYRTSLALDAELGERLENLRKISGKTRNALVEELIIHSLAIAEEHYKELRIRELRRLEKEKKKPYKNLK